MLGYELLDYPSYVHRHELQGVAFAVGRRISTSGGQRCLRLQPTQSIQVKSTHNRSILTDKKGQIRQALLVEAAIVMPLFCSFFSSKIVSITALLLVQVSSSRDGVAWRRDQSGV